MLLLQEAALLPVDGGLLHRAVRSVLVGLTIAKGHRDGPLQYTIVNAWQGYTLLVNRVQGGEGGKVDMGFSQAKPSLRIQHRCEATAGQMPAPA